MLAEGTDPAAVGAMVTVALCGHWEHDGPCRWPHHNQIDGAQFRTVFIATPETSRRSVAGFELHCMASLAGASFRTTPAGWRQTSRRWRRDWRKHHDGSSKSRDSHGRRATRLLRSHGLGPFTDRSSPSAATATPPDAGRSEDSRLIDHALCRAVVRSASGQGRVDGPALHHLAWGMQRC